MFWDWESRYPDRFFASFMAPELVRQVRRHLAGRDAILDYGCGAGQLVDELLRCGHRAAGTDSSPATVEALRRRLDGRSGFLGAFRDEELLASGAPRFDAIFVAEVVEHLYDDWLDELLARLRLLARPDARIVFTTPNEEDLEESSLPCPCCGRPFHRWQHVRSWSRTGLVRHLEARGFPAIESFTSDFYLSFGRPGKRLETGLKKLKYWRKPHKKRPHLAVVTRIEPAPGR